MVAIAPTEWAAGLVAFLEPALLRADGDTWVKCAAGRDVEDRGHYFLCLAVQEGLCVAAPLYSTFQPDRLTLDETGKHGHAPQWRGNAGSYVHPWQLWRFSRATGSAASPNDNSPVHDRRRYDKPEAILAIIGPNVRGMDWRRPSPVAPTP
ncbi:hypothetical protein ACEYYB_00890 [Paracoccus sp. p4-l81]|uniref:hypothetical protein n=1 Tax=Paracoccus sp. p4-l81 TaxID=3342806 RepID=UPI0035B6B6DC